MVPSCPSWFVIEPVIEKLRYYTHPYLKRPVFWCDRIFYSFPTTLYVYKALQKNSGTNCTCTKHSRKILGLNCMCTKLFGKTPGPIVRVQSTPENFRTWIVRVQSTSEKLRGQLYLYKALRKNSGTELSTDFYLRNFSEADCPRIFVFGIFPKMIDHRFLSSEFFRGRLYTDFCEIIFAWCDWPRIFVEYFFVEWNCTRFFVSGEFFKYSDHRKLVFR